MKTRSYYHKQTQRKIAASLFVSSRWWPVSWGDTQTTLGKAFVIQQHVRPVRCHSLESMQQNVITATAIFISVV